MSLVNQFVQMQAFKHDGSFHRQWSHGFVVADNEDYFVVFSNKAKVVEADGRVWHSRESAVLLFSKKEWFNVIASLREDGVHFYTNIASPTIYDKGFLKFIDYDLDVKRFSEGVIKALDLREFKIHSEKYNYSPELIELLNSTMKKHIELMEKHQEPYVEENILKYADAFKEFCERQISKSSNSEKRTPLL